MSHKPTLQQQTVIDAAIAGNDLCIAAYAGCAKTSTLEMVANQIYKPSLFICYNKSIATEAQTRFPKHVQVSTIHSLAWRAIVKSTSSAYGIKLNKNNGSLSLADVPCEIYGRERLKTTLMVKSLVESFCNSDYLTIEEFLESLLPDQNHPAEFAWAKEYWELVSAEHETEVAMSHDVYLKLYQQTKPIWKTPQGTPVGLVYLDEGQDSNPITLSLFLMQTQAQKIIVGDTYQSIYKWRGSIDALTKLPPNFINLNLSESFRFTPEIAAKATNLINITGETTPVIGLAKEGNIESVCQLYRTNLSLFRDVVTYINENPCNKVKMEIDLREIYNKLYHLQALRNGERPRLPNKALSIYTEFKDVLEAAEEGDIELKQLIQLSMYVSKQGGVYNVSKLIDGALAKKGERFNITFSTIHKSKGLEWDRVIINSDIDSFFQKRDFNESVVAAFLVNNSLLELCYVALTRARYEATLPYYLNLIVNKSNELNWTMVNDLYEDFKQNGIPEAILSTDGADEE